MTENPYRLARDICGIGFKTADVIAMKPGIEKTEMVRVRAGISYALTEAMDEGHCACLELQAGTVVGDRVGESPVYFWLVCIAMQSTIHTKPLSFGAPSGHPGQE